MKNISTAILLAFTAFGLLSSCSKNGNGNGASSTDSLFVYLSRDTVEANQFDYVQITVKDLAGNDITGACSLYVNNVNRISTPYYPAGPGTCMISASKGNRPCVPKRLVVLPASPSPFSQKALVEDVTGTWCGFCTRVSHALEQIKAGNPRVITVGVHGGGSDPFKFRYYTTLTNAFGISGSFPTVLLNRKEEWDEYPATITGSLERWSPLGLAISSNIGSGEITGTVKVKFQRTTTTPMKLVIALVENGLVYPQTNYYCQQYGNTPYLYGNVSPVNDFVHNGVLRRTSTDLFGDDIPVSEQVQNNEYEVPFTLSLSGVTYDGVSFTAVGPNCGVVAFVVDASPAKSGTLNVQYAAAGAVQDFD